MRSWLNHTRKVKWLTVNHTHLETRKPPRLKNGNLPYRCRFTIFPLGFNFPTILIHFFYQVKSWQNRCSSECENWMSEMFPGANSIEALMILNDDKTWTMDKDKKNSPPTKSKCNLHWVPNWTVEFSVLQKALRLEFVRIWIHPFVVQHCPME